MKKIDRIWANSGTKTAPSTGKQDTGWIDNEQVPFEWLNWLQDKVEQKINEIIKERVNSYYDEATDYQKMISTGLWDDSWGLTSDTANVIIGGSTKAYVDMAVYFNASDLPRLLLLDATNNKIEMWDTRDTSASTPEDISDALTDDLPTGSGQTWEPYSMCTDGTSVYVMFRDTNASPDTHQIQAWDITTWDVKSGWAVTGTVLSGTGNSSLTTFPDGRVIIADSTKLATSNTWNVVSAASSAAISIINISDGSIAASGAGDCPTGISTQSQGRPCSDGTNIFFSTYKAGSLTYICSATIANPQVGCGGTNYPLSVGTDYNGKNIVSCGSDMIISLLTDDLPTSALEDFIRTHNTSDADLDILDMGQDSHGVPILGRSTHLYATFDACFDGVNTWVLGAVLNSATGIGNLVLAKIDVASLSTIDTNIERNMGDVISAIYYIAPGVLWSGGSYKQQSVACRFDGRDIWCIVEPRASQTNSGKIFRLPLALLRS